MSREDIQTNVRLPVELKNALQEEATSNRRSLSAEIVDRLTGSFVPKEVIDSLSTTLVGEQSGKDWIGSIRYFSKQKDDAFYSVLVKVADTLSSDTRNAEKERNILADVVKLMARIRTGHYGP